MSDPECSVIDVESRRYIGGIVDRLNSQHGGDTDPLEPVGSYLDRCGRPSELLVAIGATRYTPFGEATYLRPGDESIVVVYDSAAHAPDDVAATLEADAPASLAASVLIQRVG